MSSRIPTPAMGEILTEEFMIPMNLTAYKLADNENDTRLWRKSHRFYSQPKRSELHSVES